MPNIHPSDAVSRAKRSIDILTSPKVSFDMRSFLDCLTRNVIIADGCASLWVQISVTIANDTAAVTDDLQSKFSVPNRLGSVFQDMCTIWNI